MEFVAYSNLLDSFWKLPSPTYTTTTNIQAGAARTLGPLDEVWRGGR